MQDTGGQPSSPTRNSLDRMRKMSDMCMQGGALVTRQHAAVVCVQARWSSVHVKRLLLVARPA